MTEGKSVKIDKSRQENSRRFDKRLVNLFGFDKTKIGIKLSLSIGLIIICTANACM